MNLDFSDEQKMIRASAGKFLKSEVPKDLVRELEGIETGYPLELWQKLVDLGWTGLFIPENFGGMGMNFLDLIVLFEEIGYNLLPGPFFSTIVSAIPIILGGSEEQKGRYLPQISEGKLKLSLALIEPTATYDPSGIRMEARREGKDFVINGTKLFVDYAHVADFFIGAVRTGVEENPEDGVSLFIIDSKSPGISVNIIPTIGLDKQCEVNFTNVKVAENTLLGDLGNGWPILEKTIQMGSVCKCAEMLGGMKAAMEMTIDYLKQRIAYGRPIASFQVIQHYLADVWVQIQTSENLIYEAAWLIKEGLSASIQSSVAKAWVGKAFSYVTERCVHMHGAIGITREHDIGLYYRQAKACDLTFGDVDFHRELLVRKLRF